MSSFIHRQKGSENKERDNGVPVSTTASTRPTSLSLTAATNASMASRYLNIDMISISPSPIDPRPRLFQGGSRIDAATFTRIEADVTKKLDIITKGDKKVINEDDTDDTDDEDEDKDDDEDEDRSLNKEVFNDLHEREMQRLSQIIQATQPAEDDDAAHLVHIIMNESNVQLQTSSSIDTSTTTTTTPHPYPPINQTGTITDHDRPYADYGHLKRQIIAQECQFDLQQSPTNQQIPPRLNAKSFAITSMTNVSKEIVMNKLKDEFDIKNIQYICIAEETSELNHQQHLHIQIIFKEKIDRRKPFLDEITKTHCNYQVTNNDCAWNEYIKKGGNFIEFNEFKSTTKRGRKQWPPPSSSSSSSTPLTVVSAAAAATPIAGRLPVVAVPVGQHQQLVPRTTTTTTTTTTVRAQAEERRKHRIEVYTQAVELAKINIDDAMDLIRREMIDKFVEHSAWLLATFNYVHLRAQRDADRRGDIDKDYIWPDSFPDCTPQLRDAVNRWIRHHFSRAKRAKCLILIGPTGTGKTSFALSLPGRTNYFQERWNLDLWNNCARYSVYDDIPWDEFDTLKYPNKKNLLTQKCQEINATDKYRETKAIKVQQPAIVLLNPEDAGSLLEPPTSRRQEKLAQYWKKRAFIYIMGPDEYFYKRQRSTTTTRRNKDNNTNTVADSQQVSSNSSSGTSNSSMNANEQRMGQPDEFDRMRAHYQQRH
ncbi:unnamed protein product [Rotaria magnacalcarata]|uniref:Replication-associated protein n=1 Tax=Rotaria magnacalcarata TaxID=392030 RepID=A0A815U0V3_9BILA|nr:unnamed protein product [Rotaria magnacalcarata]CAF1520312.1 unnamed protein product [Rotaria magnacalcarata]CAF2046872.1 unnamed protein product [Rotaria magnacalcarata]CAF3756206.1 unnamed protein product [Rotaria magnacalcarata]CAF3876331.1 unnamed protein product [Rotaria magnacalcarata]